MVAAVAGPVLGVIVGGEGGREELPHRWWQRAGPYGELPRNNGFFIFFKNSLPSVGLALGKVFAECSTKNTRQRQPCRVFVRQVPFAECNTRQSLCRVFFGLRRVPWTRGKATDSGSAGCIVYPLF